MHNFFNTTNNLTHVILESHVHALLNLVYLSGLPTKFPRPVLPELDCKSLTSIITFKGVSLTFFRIQF